MSYASCDWSVTVFISGFANTVVTRESFVEFKSTYLNPLACGSGSHKLSNSPKLSLSCLYQAVYKGYKPMLRVTKYINIIKHQSPAVTRYITTAYCRCNSAEAEYITEHFH